MIGWGVISAATAEARSFGGLVAVRITVGAFEAAFFPGAVVSGLSCGPSGQPRLRLLTVLAFLLVHEARASFSHSCALCWLAIGKW
jgi:hypothetical protein